MEDTLKLYVWRNVLEGWHWYHEGIMFALAHTKEEAKKVIISQDEGHLGRKDPDGYLRERYIELEENEPEVFESPIGFAVKG